MDTRNIYIMRENVEEKKQKKRTRDFEAMPPLAHELKWTEEPFTPSKLLKQYEQHNLLPVIVKVTRGFQGENYVDTIEEGQVALVMAFEAQRRVLARDTHGRLISIPEEWSVKFRVKEKIVRRSKPKYLKEITNEYNFPVHVYFDKLPKWKFKTGKKPKTNLKFGGLQLLGAYTETYMKGMPVVEGDVETSEEKMITLPLYALIHMHVAIGIKKGTYEDLTKVIEMYKRNLQKIDFSHVHGTSDVLLYDHRFYMFNKELIKTMGDIGTDTLVTNNNSVFVKERMRDDEEDDDEDNASSQVNSAIPAVVVSTSESEEHTSAHIADTKVKNVDERVTTQSSVSTSTSDTVTKDRDVPDGAMYSIPNKNKKVDTQTEIDEHGRKTMVSIQVINGDDENYHSTDSGVQMNSPKASANKGYSQDHTFIDLSEAQGHRENIQYVPRMTSSTDGLNLKQDEVIYYPSSSVSLGAPDWRYRNDGGYSSSVVITGNQGQPIQQNGPHISKVVWEEPSQPTPVYHTHRSLLTQPMNLQFTSGGSLPHNRVISRSFTDIRAPQTPDRYVLRTATTPVRHVSTTSRSVQDVPVSYRLAGAVQRVPQRTATTYNSPQRAYSSRTPIQSSSSSVFYSLDRGQPSQTYDMRDTVSDIGMSSSRTPHYSSLHVDIPDSYTYYDAREGLRYEPTNQQSQYRKVKVNKQRSHSARRHRDIPPQQQVYVIDRRENKQLRPPQEYQEHADLRSYSSSTDSPNRTPVKVVHVPRGRRPQRTSSYIDVISGRVTRSKTSSGDEIDSSFDFRSLDQAGRVRRERHWREIPMTQSDDDEEEDIYPEERFGRNYSSPVGGRYEPMINVHGQGVQLVYATPTYTNSAEFLVSPRRDGKRRKEPAPLAIEEMSSLSSETEDEHREHIKRGTYTSTVRIGPEDSSYKESTDSFSPKESTTSLMSPSSEQFSPPLPPSPPPPPPPPPEISESTSYKVEKAIIKQESNRGVHNNINDDLHLELKTKIAAKSIITDGSVNETEIIKQSGTLADGDDIKHIEVVMREKTDTHTDENGGRRSSTTSMHSLRQAYVEKRDSFTGSNVGLSVASTEQGFQDVLNSPSKSESLKGTTKSSGYGSISSKTETEDTHKVIRRNKSPHRKPEGMSDTEEHAVRDSILSIKELDEFLKTQLTDHHSDSETEPEIETSHL